MPRTLLAGEEVGEILRLVPADDWTFKAYPAGTSSRRRAPDGPRLATIDEELKPYGSGVSLVFADHRTEFGSLRLFRNEGEPPFSVAELHVLRIALHAISRRLSRVRLVENGATDDGGAPAVRWLRARATEAVLYILDCDFAVVLAPSRTDGTADVATPPFVVERRLPAFIERAVRELVESWEDAEAPRGTFVAQPASFLTVRVEPLIGLVAGCLAVHVEEVCERDALTRAARAFAITPREAQTLALVMDGLRISDISERLSVSPSTIRDHIKSLLTKTGTFNRAAMVARVLGWERHPLEGPGSPPARETAGTTAG